MLDMPPRVVEAIAAEHRSRQADLLRSSRDDKGKHRITLTVSMD